MKEIKLNRIDIFSIVLGAIIGWGSFMLPGTKFLKESGVINTFLGLFLGVICIIIIEKNYLIMMQTHDEEGGEFSFTYNNLGKKHGFIVGWFLTLAYFTMIPLNATAFPLVIKKIFGGILEFGYLYNVAGYNIYLGEILTSSIIIIAFAASVLNLVIGVLYGGIAGFLGGKVDNIMMRIVDILYSIPTLIYVVLLMSVLKKEGSSGMFAIIVAMAISSWVGMARIVRGDILQLKQQEFVLAAKTLGASKTRILLRHLIPNCLGSIIVTMTLFVPSAIFTEAFLSYIGLGLNAPLASLGTLANDAKGLLPTQPYQLLFPAAMICLIILAFNLFGDGLSEALDPKNRK